MSPTRTAPDPRPVHPADRLTDAIRGIDTTALDCMQVNAAVLADAAHGPETHLALGARLRFAPRLPGPGRLPTVEPAPIEQIRSMQQPLGLALETGPEVTDGEELLRLLPEDGHLYAVADAHRMPWLPYHNHQHMDHSVLLRSVAGGTRVEAVDAYDNETPYGRAEPVVCVLERAEAAALFDGSPILPVTARPAPPPALDVRRTLEENARDAAELLHDDTVTRYAAAFRDHPDQIEACTALLLETWLLNRSRRLHAAWTARHLPGSPLAAATAEQADAWDALAGQCYLAVRRVQRGRPAPPQISTKLTELLSADARLAAEAAHPGTGENMPLQPAQVRETVVDTVADILRTHRETVAAADELSRLDGFASFQMVETVERLEDTYGVQFAPGDLEPAVLRRVDGLVDLVLRTTGVQAAHQ
ncbi:hypothetical protein STENM223S_10463 [Streptomyces tendae]